MTPREFVVSEGNITNAIDNLDIQQTKIAIVGGHYMLLYEKKSDSLKPAIHEEFNDWGNKTFSKKNALNFPVKSFELAVKLFMHFRMRKTESQCVLLVNDDSLFKKNFRNKDHYEAVKDRGLELRQNYYSTNNNIPSVFKKILYKYDIPLKDFFAKFETLNSTPNSLLPRETIFVSERRLCRNFKKTVKAAATGDRLFKILKINETGIDNIEELTVESNKVDSICLIEQSVCNCGGKAFQFYHDLINKGFETIIFFVPDQCKEQVKDGTDLICSSKMFEEKLIHIINITNIESNPDDEVSDKDIIIHYYTNKTNFEKQTI